MGRVGGNMTVPLGILCYVRGTKQKITFVFMYKIIILRRCCNEQACVHFILVFELAK